MMSNRIVQIGLTILMGVFLFSGCKSNETSSSQSESNSEEKRVRLCLRMQRAKKRSSNP